MIELMELLLRAGIAVVIAIAIPCYVVYSLAHMKALKALGYDKPWMAWIPFANYYAYADSVTKGRDNVTLFGNLTVPVMVYKFWWIGLIVAKAIKLFIPTIGSVLKFALSIAFLGDCYVKMYARLDNTPEVDQQVLGYLSGVFPIIAVVKFLVGK